VLRYLIIDIGTHLIHRFWEHTIPHASAQSQKRFIATLDDYLEAVVQQAVDRGGCRVRGVQSYIDLRRDMSGVKPCFALLELGLDIPDEVMSHSTIEDMAMTSNDMISLINVNVSDFLQA